MTRRRPLPPRIGPYAITGVLGQGGMGIVYRGRHVELGVERAVKVMLRGDARAQARFEREVTHLARVQHPNVVRIHEAGLHQGQRYFTMELVDGQPLDQLLRAGRPALRDALTLGAGVCRGVDALHAAGVIHRDLKPSNVLITAEGRPVVVDVGLALAPEQDDRLTRTGAMVGTIAYMAPEQLTGEPVSPATDVFALGLLVFELTTGQGAVEERSTAAGLVASAMREDRPRPGDIDPRLPAKLDAVCARATARAPAARYARAGDLADALEDVRRAPGPSRHQAQRAHRRRVGALALAALAALLGAAAATAALRSRPHEDPSPAIEPRDEDILRALSRLGAPGEVVARADAWLATHREDPDRPRVEARRRDARRRLGDVALAPLRAWPDDRRATPAYLEQVVAWVGSYPDHPEAGRLRTLARASARRVPLATLEPAHEARFVPGSQGRLALLLLRHAQGSLTLWDLEAHAPVRRWEGIDAAHLALSPDGAAAYVRSGSRILRLRLDTAALEQVTDLRRSLRAMALSPDGRTLAVGDGDGVVHLLSAGTGAPQRALSPVSTYPCALAFTRRGHRLLVGNWGLLVEGKGPCVRLHDVATGDLLREVPLVGSVARVALSPDDRVAAVGTGMGRIFLIDVDVDDIERPARVLVGEGRGVDGATVAEPRASDGCVGGLAFSPDGRWLTSASFGGDDERDPPAGELTLWDLSTRREVAARALLRRPVDGFDLDAADDPRGLGRRLLLAAGATAPCELWLWTEGLE